jgi:hypothetical protein
MHTFLGAKMAVILISYMCFLFITMKSSRLGARFLSAERPITGKDIKYFQMDEADVRVVSRGRFGGLMGGGIFIMGFEFL